MERRQRIATLASYLFVSAIIMVTSDVALKAGAGAAVAIYIAHMKAIIEKSERGLGFINTLKLTKDQLIVFEVTIIGGVIVVIISRYVLTRIAKVYCHYRKKLAEYAIASAEDESKNLEKLGNFAIPFVWDKIFLAKKDVLLIFLRVLNLQMGLSNWLILTR
jgi:hypothetical protein